MAIDVRELSNRILDPVISEELDTYAESGSVAKTLERLPVDEGISVWRCPLEFADGELDEVARHLGRRLERDLFRRRPCRFLARDRHVAHGGGRARDGDGEGECRFQ